MGSTVHNGSLPQALTSNSTEIFFISAKNSFIIKHKSYTKAKCRAVQHRSVTQNINAADECSEHSFTNLLRLGLKSNVFAPYSQNARMHATKVLGKWQSDFHVQ